MTPRVDAAQVRIGDRVADKRWKGKKRPGRGTVVAVYQDCARVRWDGSGRDGIRDLAMIERIDNG